MNDKPPSGNFPIFPHGTIPEPIPIGEPSDERIQTGYRVIANDTSTGRPWMWYACTLEAANLLGATLADHFNQEVVICRYVGKVVRPKQPALFYPAHDTSSEEVVDTAAPSESPSTPSAP